jgi:hypothetical protein
LGRGESCEFLKCVYYIKNSIWCTYGYAYLYFHIFYLTSYLIFSNDFFSIIYNTSIVYYYVVYLIIMN